MGDFSNLGRAFSGTGKPKERPVAAVASKTTFALPAAPQELYHTPIESFWRSRDPSLAGIESLFST